MIFGGRRTPAGRRQSQQWRTSGCVSDALSPIAGSLNYGQVPRAAGVCAGEKQFTARVRIDTPREAEYFRHGGILQYALRQLL